MYDIIYVTTNADTSKFTTFSAVYPHARSLRSSDDILEDIVKARAMSYTEMYWFITDDVDLPKEADLSWKPVTWDKEYLHGWRCMQGEDTLIDCALGVYLIPRRIAPNDRMFDTVKIMDNWIGRIRPLDVFFVGYHDLDNHANFQRLMSSAPHVKTVHANTGMQHALRSCAELSTTSMFFTVDADTVVDAHWDFSFHPPIYDKRYLHVWHSRDRNNGLEYEWGGVKLWPRRLAASLSGPCLDFTGMVGDIKMMPQTISTCDEDYDIFFISDDTADAENRLAQIKQNFPRIRRFVQQQDISVCLQQMAQLSGTEMFYTVDADTMVDTEWDFSFHPPIYDRRFMHVWHSRNHYNGLEYEWGGVKLWPRDAVLTSGSSNYDLTGATTLIKMMPQVISSCHAKPFDVFFISYHEPTADANFELLRAQIPYAKRINGITGMQHALRSCAELSTTSMFFTVDADTVVDAHWDFTFVPEPYDRRFMHVWHSRNHYNGLEYEWGGVKLWPKRLTSSLSDSWLDLTGMTGDIKMMPQVISSCHAKPFDVFFISYHEPTADANFARLQAIVPRAKRVDGIKGISNAHRRCAELSETGMFFTVDADTIVDTTWDFTFVPPIYDRGYLHIWHSRNPVNDLQYGWGGIKLWPRDAVIDFSGKWLDFTTTVGKIKIMPHVISTSAFNADAASAWRSGFREAVKLVFNVRGGDQFESLERLMIWITSTTETLHATECRRGAIMGMQFAIRCIEQSDTEQARIINDFDRLSALYLQHHHTQMINYDKSDVLNQILGA